MIPHDDQVILFPHEDNCIQGIFHMPPWPNFPPWPCLDSELPSNTELSLLCHNDESGRTSLRLRTTCFTYSTHMITLWLFNIAMENGPFIDGVPIKNGDFPCLC